MGIILILILVGFLLGTFYMNIEFWINFIGYEHAEKIIAFVLFTFPFFPIFGTIELLRRLLAKIPNNEE